MSNGRPSDDSDNGKDPDPTVESEPVKPPHVFWAAAAGGLIGGLIGALIGSGLS
jgi:hypothetical protein